MQLKKIIGIIIIIIAIGWIIGLFLNENNQGCTELGCPCRGVTGERSCNTCFSSNTIFATGILNVVKQCRSSEIITCENNVQIDSRIDSENKNCRTDWYIFGFNLGYLFTDPEKTVTSDIG